MGAGLDLHDCLVRLRRLRELRILARARRVRRRGLGSGTSPTDAGWRYVGTEAAHEFLTRLVGQPASPWWDDTTTPRQLRRATRSSPPPSTRPRPSCVSRWAIRPSGHGAASTPSRSRSRRLAHPESAPWNGSSTRVRIRRRLVHDRGQICGSIVNDRPLGDDKGDLQARFAAGSSPSTAVVDMKNPDAATIIQTTPGQSGARRSTRTTATSSTAGWPTIRCPSHGPRTCQCRHEADADPAALAATAPSRRPRAPTSDTLVACLRLIPRVSGRATRCLPTGRTLPGPKLPEPRPSSAPPGFHLLAKPTGAVCNLDCTYCFFLSKEALYPGSPFRMADDVLELYIKQSSSRRTRPPPLRSPGRAVSRR